MTDVITRIEETWAAITEDRGPVIQKNTHPFVQQEVTLASGSDTEIVFPSLVYVGQGLQRAEDADGRTSIVHPFLLDFRSEDYRDAMALAEAFRKATVADGWDYQPDDFGFDLVLATVDLVPRTVAICTYRA